jgi:Rod binding domain-containing protein
VSSAGQPSPKLKEAAGQFEALLLAQMLKSARGDASGGWLGTGGDEAGGAILEVAEEHLAQVLAAQGGLGLARLVADGLSGPAGG